MRFQFTRQLGAARTGAYFATAPFVGAVLAVLWLAEPLTWQLSMAGALMPVGGWLRTVTQQRPTPGSRQARTESQRSPSATPCA